MGQNVSCSALCKAFHKAEEQKSTANWLMAAPPQTTDLDGHVFYISSVSAIKNSYHKTNNTSVINQKNFV